MSNLIVLEQIQLIPVVELVPSRFSTESRKSPAGTFRDVPEEWYRYWTASLADAGIIGLEPLRPGSWHVPTVNFDGVANLQRFLEKTFQEWGGIDSLSDPDIRPVLNGGLVLQDFAGDLLIPPGCCADLGDSKNWRTAAACQEAEWQMLWIGHPWLSVRCRPPWLELSEPHESKTPTERWAVSSEVLHRAVHGAEAELERFAGEIAQILPMLGCREDPFVMSHKLAGLRE